MEHIFSMLCYHQILFLFPIPVAHPCTTIALRQFCGIRYFAQANLNNEEKQQKRVLKIAEKRSLMVQNWFIFAQLFSYFVCLFFV